MSDIDAVITWVDGSTPEFQASRSRRAAEILSKSPEIAKQSQLRFVSQRFVQHEELRLCLRSIVKFAPWIRKIWLVTDNQFPGFLNKDLINNFSICVVDHREIFRGKFEHLPVFNSNTIEFMIHRIEGLAERYIYFNDDCFLSSPVTEDDFFILDFPIIRGKWKSNPKNVPIWLSSRINVARLFGKSLESFFLEYHTPHPFIKPQLQECIEFFHNEVNNQLNFSFRNYSDLNVVSLYNNYLLKEFKLNIYRKKDHKTIPVIKSINDISKAQEACKELLDGKFKSVCFNGMDGIFKYLPDMIGLLDAYFGPPLPFEIRDFGDQLRCTE